MDRPPKSNDKSPTTLDQTCARAWQALRIAHELVARRLTTDLGKQCGLTINDFDVLLHLSLAGNENVRMTELTEAAILSQPALSRLVSRLEERGLVARAPAVDDGRVVMVRLTAAGNDLARRAIQVHAEAVHDVLASRLTDDEQDTLRQTLTRLAESDAT